MAGRHQNIIVGSFVLLGMFVLGGLIVVYGGGRTLMTKTYPLKVEFTGGVLATARDWLTETFEDERERTACSLRGSCTRGSGPTRRPPAS